jgi:predicted PurR-regulated permease PerM
LRCFWCPAKESGWRTAFSTPVDRLLGAPGERLASKVANAIRGTVHGTVTVALAEAAIIGFGFVLAGVPHTLLFAVLTMAFAMRRSARGPRLPRRR